MDREMAEERMERRLSAILAADIAGYSALMGADEARTVHELKGHQSVVLPMIGNSSDASSTLPATAFSPNSPAW